MSEEGRIDLAVETWETTALDSIGTGMKEADWTPSPHAERETDSLRRRSRLEGRLSVWIAGVTSVTAVASGCMVADLVGRGKFIDAGNAAVVFLISAGLTFWLAARDNDLLVRVAAPDRAKREEFGSGSGWIVDLMVLQGDAPTGADRGMLWIEGGRLLFSGDRTSFALSADQVAASCRSVLAISGLRHPMRVPLQHRTPAGQLALSLQTGENSAEVRWAIDGWAASGSTDGQFPPLRIGPGVAPTSRLLLGAVLASAFCVAAATFVGASFLVGMGEGLFSVFLMMFLGGILRLLPLATRWRAWRDRRRLEGGDR